MSLAFLWNQIQKTGSSVASSYEQLAQIIQPSKHTRETSHAARSIICSFLQTKEQLELACEDIYATAVADGVICEGFRFSDSQTWSSC